ncbi:MAG: response regulator [Flavobacteriaceae bacterium]
MIQILVLDPHPIVHAGFEKIVSQTDSFALAPSANLYNHAFKILDATPVDIIVMDMELQGISPVTLIEQFREKHSKVKIVVFSNQPTKVYAVSLLKAGATAYLSKKTNTELLVEALQYVHDKGFYVTSQHRNQLNYNVDVDYPRTNFEILSPREIEVLKFLVDGAKNIDIAKQLEINQKTVNTYKKCL